MDLLSLCTCQYSKLPLLYRLATNYYFVFIEFDILVAKYMISRGYIIIATNYGGKYDTYKS